MNLKKLRKLFGDKGCIRLLFKELAANDNSKNQIYLGGDFTAVSVIPCSNIREHRSGDMAHTGRTGKEIFKADVEFAWLDDTGGFHPAPNVQMIMYPQYPEVRISGFLKGCSGAPGDLIRQRQAGRIMFFGIRNDGAVAGYVTGHNSPLATEVRMLRGLSETGVFREIPLEERKDSRTVLLNELGRIHGLGWIKGKRLSRRGVLKYNASNAGGYTLEAELGISPNGYSEPDFLGWEVKQHGVTTFDNIAVGRITLMTPEPTAGYYKDKGAEAFVRKFGGPDRTGRPNRLNFGGVHVVGVRNERTGLTMRLEGYESEKRRIVAAGGGISLITDEGEVAAKWPFAGIIDHWKRKHSQAVYVPAKCRKTDTRREYWFGPVVRLGQGTDVLLLLEAMAQQLVYYDPGIKLENVSGTPRLKRRSQFRIKSRDVPALYSKMTEEAVHGGR